MADSPWFLNEVSRGVRSAPRTVHIVCADGTVMTVEAKAVVFADNDRGVVVRGTDYPGPQPSVATMLVSIDRKSPFASLVIHPGAANVVIVRCVDERG